MRSTSTIACMLSPAHAVALECPYSGASDICGASLSSLSPSLSVRTSYCSSEDYDSCPIFLARALRRNRR
jgi:hypothetical protein